VNTTATYSLNDNGSIKVENSGNYFFNNGPQSSITGSAVPVNAYKTRLQVGFFFAQPNPDEPAAEPGNYWILDYAPDYTWAIVGDPNGTSGYILTRDKIVDQDFYDALVARAYQLGVNRTIIRTQQFPAAVPAAVLPGPATLPNLM
jgi:lipocalin